MTRKCLEVLNAEHKIILRIADVLESTSNRARSHSEYDEHDVEGMLQILRNFGDDFHQAKEEDVLFPAVTELCDGSQHAAIRHMLLEHEQDRSLMTGIQEAIARSNAAQYAEYSARLANVLRVHVFKEDNLLFGMIAGQLNDKDDAKIVAGFEPFDRAFEARKGELLQCLRLLEWKYLRKVT